MTPERKTSNNMNQGIIRKLSKLAKNKIVQYSLAGLTGMASLYACGPSKENRIKNSPPIVSDIPNQTINKGGIFNKINLCDYFYDSDNSCTEASWNVSGNKNLVSEFDSNNGLNISYPAGWTGSETLKITATDPYGTSGSDSAIFNVNAPPVVSDIPNQTINEGGGFYQLTLDDYVYDSDNSDSEISWNVTGNSALNTNIDLNRNLNISYPAGWTGSETLKITATDPYGLQDSYDAIFTVNNVNDSPHIISTPLTTSTENSDYEYDVDATDPDNDIITYSLVPATAQVPSFLSIDSLTGIISGIPLDQHSNQTHTVKVRAEDPYGKYEEQTFNLYVKNVEDVAGNVKSFDSDLGLNRMEITINRGDGTIYSATTNQFGDWQIPNVLDGDYETMIKDINNPAVYETYKPRILRVNKTKNLEGKLNNRDAKLFLIADRNFINDAGRLDPLLTSENVMRKWCPDALCSKPIWDIYIREWNSQNPVDISKVNMVKDAIKNEISQFANDSYNFTDADINVIDSIPFAGQPADGHIKVKWDSNIAGGHNHEYLDGNKVISGFIGCNTYQGKSTWLQELAESLIGSGESNDYPSIFNDPQDYPVDYNFFQPKDLIISEMHFNPKYQRPAGNKDYNTDDNHDKDPDGTVWNE